MHSTCKGRGAPSFREAGKGSQAKFSGCTIQEPQLQQRQELPFCWLSAPRGLRVASLTCRDVRLVHSDGTHQRNARGDWVRSPWSWQSHASSPCFLSL